MTDIARKHTS
jgi:regulator of replication initiation timing